MKKSMKKAIAMTLCAAMAFSLTACGGSGSKNTSETAAAEAKEQKKTETKAAKAEKTTPEKIVLLGQASSEANLNILRDQLGKAGFDVEINMQPDYASMTAQQDAGNFDLLVTGWTTVTGNVDYAVRGIFHSTGDYNKSPLIDDKVDELIDKGATETAEEAVATYTELENYLVGEMAYLFPLYSSMKMQAYNNELIKAESVYQPKSRPGRWEMYEYNDPANNDGRTLTLTQASASPTSLDPIQANDGTMNTLSGNMYVKIVNLTDDDAITTDSSLSRAYAIAEGNSEYYFLLRDDVYFSKAENGHVVNTGVRVGGEDVVFSLNRAKDKNSVATHKTYTLHNHMAEIEMVTDLDELNNVKETTGKSSIMEVLNAGAKTPIAALTDDEEAADNAAGTYQVVKVTTTEPFPQVLNYLAHQSAGILNKDQVTEMNSKFEVASYDPTKDVCYGYFSAVKSGNNHLWCSGPYQFVTVDDYGINFEKNPGYMADDAAFAPRIANIYVKFIKDTTSATSAFRAGEIDLLGSVTATDVDVVESDSKFTVMKKASNGVTYCVPNMREGSKLKNVDLRLAILYAINQDDFIAYNNGYVNPVYSTVGTLIDTGNVLKQDLVKSAEHLAAYQAAAAK